MGIAGAPVCRIGDWGIAWLMIGAGGAWECFKFCWAWLRAGLGFGIFLANWDVVSAGGILLVANDRRRWSVAVYGVPGGLGGVRVCRVP